MFGITIRQSIVGKSTRSSLQLGSGTYIYIYIYIILAVHGNAQVMFLLSFWLKVSSWLSWLVALGRGIARPNFIPTARSDSSWLLAVVPTKLLLTQMVALQSMIL